MSINLSFAEQLLFTDSKIARGVTLRVTLICSSVSPESWLKGPFLMHCIHRHLLLKPGTKSHAKDQKPN